MSTVWCPTCGSEYVAGTARCADCGVELVDENAADREAGVATDLVEMGEWPRLPALLLRRRLESAGVPVMIEWQSTSGDALGVLIVPEDHADFAWSVIQEVAPDEEMPDRSPEAYVAAIDESLATAAALLDELRASLELGDE